MSLEKQVLECSVCMEPYDEEDRCPRRLSCGHTFCSACLQQLLKDGKINCPQDRKEVPVVEGVDSLPKNYPLLQVPETSPVEIDIQTATYCEICDVEKHIAESYCEDCGQAMCKAMSDVHIKMRACKHHKIVPVSQVEACSSAVACCAEHNLPYSYFDKDCEIPICAACFSQNHSLHNCQSLADAAAACRSNIEILFGELQAKVAQVQTSTDRLVSMRRRLDKNHLQASCELEKAFEEIFKSATARKEELSLKLKERLQAKSDAIDEEMKALDSSRSSINRAVVQATRAMQLDEDLPLLLAYGHVSRMSKVTNLPVTSDCLSVDDLKFSGNSSDVSSRIENFACICGIESQFEAKGAGLMYAFSGCDGTFSVRKVNSGNAAIRHNTIPIKVEVKEKVQGQLPTKITDCGDTLSVSYPGIINVTELAVSVSIYGNHVKGSPFVVPKFWAKFERLVAKGIRWYTSEAPSECAWAESVPVRPGTRRVELDVSYELPCSSQIIILLVDGRHGSKSVLDVYKLSATEAVVSRPFKLEQKENVSGACRVSVDCRTQCCKIDCRTFYWYGFVKIGILLTKGGKFFVALSAVSE